MKHRHYTKIKIISGFSLILMILAALTGIWLSHVKASSASLTELAKEQRASELIFRMRNAARNRTLSLFKMATYNDPFEQEREFDLLQRHAEVFIKARDHLLYDIGLSDAEKKDWEAVRIFIIKGSKYQNKTANMLRDGNILVAKDILLNEVTPAQAMVVEILSRMLVRKKQLVAAKLIEAAKNNRAVYISISVLGGCALFIAGLISILVTNLATRSEKELITSRDNALAVNNQKSLFLANMSHELRTPLNAIIGYSEMLLDEAKNQKDQHLHSDLCKINNSGHNLLSLINDILDLSKIEANKIELYPETVNLPKLISEISGTIKPLINSRHNTLNISISDTCGNIYTDQRKIRQTLLNLLSNACKFTEQGQISVVVSDFRQNNIDMQKIAIKDNGIGMTTSQIEHLFLPFAQADASTTRKYGGTGLGLFISRHFCDILGGHLTVSSQPNKGSTFTVVIPKYLQIDSNVDLVA